MSDAKPYSKAQLQAIRDSLAADRDEWGMVSEIAHVVSMRKMFATLAAKDAEIERLTSERDNAMEEVERLRTLYEERGEQQMRLARERDEARERAALYHADMMKVREQRDRMRRERDEARPVCPNCEGIGCKACSGKGVA